MSRVDYKAAMDGETTLAVVGATAGVASLVFVGWQSAMLRKQTAAMTQQTEAMTEQTQHMRQQTELGVVAAELTFNKEVMSWLQDVLFEIADQPDIHAHVWNGSEDNRRPQLAVHAINDVLSMALAAVERLPGFSRQQGADWYAYADYVMTSCPAARYEVLQNPDWWPELNKYAEQARDREPHDEFSERAGGHSGSES